MSARTGLLDALEAAFAGLSGVNKPRLVRGPRATDSPGGQPFVVARTLTYAPLPEAPMSKVRWTGLLVVVSKHKDLIRAEDQLEELYEVLFTLPRSGKFSLGDATLTTYAVNADGSPAQLCLEVAVTSIFSQE
jgi:hypothetical protein